MIVRAMVLADRTLFMIGLPDLVDEDSVFKQKKAFKQRAEQLAAQNAAWHGKMGASLWAVSADDGKKLAEYKLDAIPIFDSLITSGGRLYYATIDGKVHCYAGK